MARLRSKGIRSQPVNTTDAQILAQNARLPAAGIAAALGSVGDAVARKKEREFRADQSELNREFQAKQSSLGRAATINAAKIRARATIAGKLIAEGKATEAKVEKLVERHAFIENAVKAAKARGEPSTELEEMLDESRMTLPALLSKLAQTQERMEKVKGVTAVASALPPIPNVPSLQTIEGQFKADQEQDKAALSKLNKASDKAKTSSEQERISQSRNALADRMRMREIHRSHLETMIAKGKDDSQNVLRQSLHAAKVSTSLKGMLERVRKAGLDDSEIVPAVQPILDAAKDDVMAVTQEEISRIERFLSNLAKEKREGFERAQERLEAEKEKTRSVESIEPELEKSGIRDSMKELVRAAARSGGTNAASAELIRQERKWADIRASRGQDLVKPGSGGTQSAFKQETNKVTGQSTRVFKPELLPDEEHTAIDLADGKIPEADHKTVIEAKWGRPSTIAEKERVFSDVAKLLRARGYDESILLRVRERFKKVWGSD